VTHLEQIVLTLNSLRALLNEDGSVPALLVEDPPARADVVAVGQNRTTYVIHRTDGLDVRLLVVMLRDGRIWPEDADPAGRVILERMLHLGILADRMPLRTPPIWGQYKSGNLIAFYACGRELGTARWIAEVQPDAPNNVCFWRFYAASEKIMPDGFRPPWDRYELAVAGWDLAFFSAQRKFAVLAPPVEVVADPGFDLSLVEFADVTQSLTLAEWMPRLTPRQRAFVTQAVDHPVELLGPAGSGKTLALELKALHEIEEARKQGRALSVLFITHSWALAEQVDADVSSLCERGIPAELTIMPLLEVARDVLPADRRRSGLMVIGEDSLSGKTAVLDRIDAVLDDFLLGDWLSFRDEVSPSLRARLDSEDPENRRAFAWDCMIEFGCVLDADGIFPGASAESRYLQLPRTAWMMPLHTDTDKQLVLALYSRYAGALEASGELTSDQLVNDLLDYLETFHWSARRVLDGYDLIFADELHLFNVRERLLLRYLARSPAEYPRILMAVDPKQSPWAFYAGLANASPASGLGSVGDEFGPVSRVSLETVHRYSPEILRLIQHLDWQFPRLDLSGELGLFSTVTSAAEGGPLPVVVSCESQAAEVSAVYEAVRSHKAAGTRGQLAIAVVDATRFGQFMQMAESLSHDGGLRLSVIASRDDTEDLQYRRRGVVVGLAEYLAGLQFDSVIVAGLPKQPTGTAYSGYRMRQYLSLLYLAITRARREVRIFVNEDNDGVPEILQEASHHGRLLIEKGPQA
jgi:hypothetical protein